MYSSDSDEDLPLSVANASWQYIPKSELLKKTKERCEICDKVYDNKYSILLHNTKHIIIPLLRQRIYQCVNCNKPFISTEALKRHTINDHLNITNENDYIPELIESFIKTEPYAVINKEELGVKEEDSITIENEGILQLFVGRQPVTLLTKEPLLCEETKEVNDEILKDFVKKESVVLEPLIINLDDDSTDCSTNNSCYEQETLVSRQPVNLLTKEPLLYEETKEVNEELLKDFVKKESVVLEPLIINLDDDSTDCSTTNSCYEQEIYRIRDKILFESDTDEDDIIQLCNGIKEPLISEVKKETENEDNGIVKANSITLGQFTIIEEQDSVHYDELIKPGVFKCKRCSCHFPNRYFLIKHEKKHMKFRRLRLGFLCRICDWYVGNNRWCYQRHMESKHPNKEICKTKLYSCRLCSLKYVHEDNHFENYHPDVKRKSPEEDDRNCPLKNSEPENSAVDGKCPGQENSGPIAKMKLITLKVCEICFMLMMKKKPHRFKVLGMYKCLERCNFCYKHYSELRLVTCKKSMVHREHKIKKKVTRCLTNMERLQKVHRRLKNLKMLNKF